MRAVLLTGHGGYEKLEYRDDVPVPRAGNGRSPDPSRRRRGQQHGRQHSHRLVLEGRSLRHRRRCSGWVFGCIHGRLVVDRSPDHLPADPGSGLLWSHRRRRRRCGRRANRGAGAGSRGHALARGASACVLDARLRARRGLRRVRQGAVDRGLSRRLRLGRRRARLHPVRVLDRREHASPGRSHER